MTRQLVVLISAVFLVIGLAATAVVQAQDTEGSVLAPGDVVRIAVYGQDDLSIVTRIADSGSISFPFIGNVNVAGLTTADAERRIAARLGEGGFVRNAQVSVFREERTQAVTQSVTILGQVVRSGRYPLVSVATEGADNLINLLALAGGTTENAADHLMLLRTTEEGTQRMRVDLVNLLTMGDTSSNHRLLDTDIVIVPQMEVFYIYGQVGRPGRYRLEKDMTVMQAIAVASGVTERGNEDGIELRRRDGDKIRTLRTDLDNSLQANDVIYVKQSFF